MQAKVVRTIEVIGRGKIGSILGMEDLRGRKKMILRHPSLLLLRLMDMGGIDEKTTTGGFGYLDLLEWGTFQGVAFLYVVCTD
jgi:hypothetical protein